MKETIEMVNKIEMIVKIRDIIYNYIYEQFGSSEANDPSWYIPTLAEEIVDRLYDENWKPQYEYYNVNDEE